MAVPDIWARTNHSPSENSFNQSKPFCEMSHIKILAKTFLPIFFWILFFVGAIGNALVILVYWRYRGKKSPTDTYLIHLAIADLLFIFTLPFWAAAAWDGWNFKTVMCKIVNSMYKTNFYSCMLFLMCVSFDRYVVVVRPMQAQNSKLKRLMRHKLICFGVWVIAVALCIPEVMYSQTEQIGNTTVCRMIYPPSVSRTLRIIDLSMKIAIGFLFPLLVMVVCYARVAHTLLQARKTPKHKSLKMIIIIILVFVLSQFPYNSILLVKTMVLYAPAIKDCKMLENIATGFQLTQSIAFLHSCLNPFLYVFAGERFRKALFQMMKCMTQGPMKSPEQCNSADASQGQNSRRSSALFGRSKLGTSLALSSP